MTVDATNIESITLRPATLADAPGLALAGAATFLEAYTWLLSGADIIAFCEKHQTAAAYAEYLQKPDTRITLAVAGNDVPVGLAMLCAPDLPTIDVQPSDVELKRIYLFSRFRSGTTPVTNYPGVRPAQALMDAAIADAREMLRKRLLLGTNADNERAIAFYRRNGFAVVGTRKFEVGARVCEDLIFAMELWRLHARAEEVFQSCAR